MLHHVKIAMAGKIQLFLAGNVNIVHMVSQTTE